MDLPSCIGNPELFPILDHWNFLNHAGISPLSAPAADALRTYAAQSQSTAYLTTNHQADLESLRQTTATLISAHRDEIAFIKNTSEGLSIVAAGLDWQWGDVIVTTAVEYPANIYPWMEAARNHGCKLVTIPEETDVNGRRAVPAEKILHAIDLPQCRLVSLSHVEFASGQRHELARIGKKCREKKVRFCVDAIQSLGVIPIDVESMHIDYLSADGHKWLMGPEGAGIFYCRREFIERTRPLMVGWMNVAHPHNYGTYDYTLKSDAGRFECGTFNIPGLLALKASMDLLIQVGTPKIFERLHLLTERLIAGLESKGYMVISPRALGQWSGIVSFVSPSHHHTPIMKSLREEHKIEIALREGRLRVSPHFYNTEMQIDALIAALPVN
jgi:cysteine desulfurase / selenocysteine lyase